MEQLTKEQLARVYGAYMFCDVKTPHGIDKLWSVYPLGFSGKEHGKFFYSNDIQLILTPLSKITDEHAELVAKHGRHNGIPSFARAGKELLDKYLWSSNCNVRPVEWFAILDYLRSKGYDCGYGEITSLIEAGIAIEKQ